MPVSAFLSDRSPECPAWLLSEAQRHRPPTVVIANAGADLPMQAAKEATEAGIMVPVFTGSLDDINRTADGLGWDISRYQTIKASDEIEAGMVAANACGAGVADVLMKGHISTDVFLKAALNKDAGLRTGARLTHVFHITAPDSRRALLLSDAAVNISPDIQTMQSSTHAVVSLLKILGRNNAKVAFLSASEKPMQSMPSSLDARRLRDWARSEIPEAHFSGPLALDVIFSAKSAGIKGIGDDPVAGNADAIIVPDIVSGNAIFKSLVYLTGACAAGVVFGAKVPLLLTSRADPPAARLASLALAAIITAANKASRS
ncbi:MAG: phosphate acetyltransferase [Alphaproteobacteria bacterium]|nr:phosphate acetyltransferase [Alphaproteobacteria bacterium]